MLTKHQLPISRDRRDLQINTYRRTCAIITRTQPRSQLGYTIIPDPDLCTHDSSLSMTFYNILFIPIYTSCHCDMSLFYFSI